MVKYISIFSFLVSDGQTLTVHLKVSVLTSNKDKTALLEALSNVSTNHLQIYIKQEQYHLCRSHLISECLLSRTQFVSQKLLQDCDGCTAIIRSINLRNGEK